MDPKDSYPIQLDDWVVEVAYRLHLALRCLQQSNDSRALWIDQLTINQADKVEVNAQVTTMRDIQR
jgi:hypothetical protein